MRRSIFYFVLCLHLIGILSLFSFHRPQPHLRKPIAVRTLLASDEVATLRAPPTPRAFTPDAPPTLEAESTPSPNKLKEFEPKPSPELPAIRHESLPPPRSLQRQPTPESSPPPTSQAPISSEKSLVKQKDKPTTKTLARAAPVVPKKSAAVKSGGKGRKGDPKSSVKAHKETLISMMQQSLTTLDGTTSQSRHSKAEPQLATCAALASESLSFESTYEEELIDYLESLLSLPEKGEVRIKLTLKKEGTVKQLEVIKSSSQRNKNYVESIVADCSFPSFGKRFKGEESHTFTITLTSENSH